MTHYQPRNVQGHYKCLVKVETATAALRYVPVQTRNHRVVYRPAHHHFRHWQHCLRRMWPMPCCLLRSCCLRGRLTCQWGPGVALETTMLEQALYLQCVCVCVCVCAPCQYDPVTWRGTHAVSRTTKTCVQTCVFVNVRVGWALCTMAVVCRPLLLTMALFWNRPYQRQVTHRHTCVMVRDDMCTVGEEVWYTRQETLKGQWGDG